MGQVHKYRHENRDVALKNRFVKECQYEQLPSAVLKDFVVSCMPNFPFTSMRVIRVWHLILLEHWQSLLFSQVSQKHPAPAQVSSINLPELLIKMAMYEECWRLQSISLKAPVAESWFALSWHCSSNRVSTGLEQHFYLPVLLCQGTHAPFCIWEGLEHG